MISGSIISGSFDKSDLQLKASYESSPSCNSCYAAEFSSNSSSFLDGYCSTVQGLLDWFEVDLGFPALVLFRLICVLSVMLLNSAAPQLKQRSWSQKKKTSASAALLVPNSIQQHTPRQYTHANQNNGETKKKNRTVSKLSPLKTCTHKYRWLRTFYPSPSKKNGETKTKTE